MMQDQTLFQRKTFKRKLRLLKAYRDLNRFEDVGAVGTDIASLRVVLDGSKPLLSGLEEMGVPLSVTPVLTAFYLDLDARCSAMMSAHHVRQKAGQRERAHHSHSVKKCIDKARDLRSVCEDMYKFLSVAMRATERMGGAGRILALSLIGLLSSAETGVDTLFACARKTQGEYGVKVTMDEIRRAGSSVHLPDLIDRLDLLCPFSASYYGCLLFLAQEYHPIAMRASAMLHHLSRETGKNRLAYLTNTLSWGFMRSDRLLDNRELQLERFIAALDHLSDRESPRLPVMRDKEPEIFNTKRFSHGLKTLTERNISLFRVAVHAIAFPVLEQVTDFSQQGFEDYVERLNASCVRTIAFWEDQHGKIVRKRAQFGLQHVVVFGDIETMYAVKDTYTLINRILSWQKYVLKTAMRANHQERPCVYNHSLSILKNTLRDLAQIRASIARRITEAHKQSTQNSLGAPINPVCDSGMTDPTRSG